MFKIHTLPPVRLAIHEITTSTFLLKAALSIDLGLVTSPKATSAP